MFDWEEPKETQRPISKIRSIWGKLGWWLVSLVGGSFASPDKVQSFKKNKQKNPPEMCGDVMGKLYMVNMVVCLWLTFLSPTQFPSLALPTDRVDSIKYNFITYKLMKVQKLLWFHRGTILGSSKNPWVNVFFFFDVY